ncbi:MAG: exodeoxyribonuclease VII large subunit [Reichenbachiella sp.]|uniref:exodeoxyribonuclease VII large subunit n=1 Tax=Reichenbachiella sp. TaxID=2184521 RepID=UPI003264E95E
MNQYSLHEFNLLVKEVLNTHLERSYWVVAEVSQINLHSNGHCYLELVEKDNNFIKAKARGTIWANTFREIHPWFVSQTGTELKQGMKILFNASFEFHEVYGVSLNIRDLDVNFTIGERERKKQETIQRLEAEGILQMNQELALPTVIQTLAIISSATAAGYEDFINQFENNSYGYQATLDLYPSAMQGDAAPQSMIDALHKIYESDVEYDAVVVIRGGGSKMDLDCFDDYELCAHLAQFPIPVITGIGHERDQSIADLVANTYLKTPTSVAEFLILSMLEFESSLNSVYESITLLAREFIHDQLESVTALSFGYQMNARQIIQRHSLLLEQNIHLINNRPAGILKQNQIELESKTKLIEAYNPASLLKKGYTITRVNGKVLKGQKIAIGDELETETTQQKIKSTIKEIK